MRWAIAVNEGGDMHAVSGVAFFDDDFAFSRCFERYVPAEFCAQVVWQGAEHVEGSSQAQQHANVLRRPRAGVLREGALD